MNRQLNRTSTELDEATLRARKVVESVSSVLVGRRPHQGSWSIAECIAHLTITTDAYIAEIRPAVNRARHEHLVDRGMTFRIGMSARILAWWLEPPYRLKTKTPAAFVPGVEEPARALPEFVERQQKLKAVMAEADGLALDGIRICSPFARQVKYNVYAAFRLIAVHRRRHLWQAERVAETLLSTRPGDAWRNRLRSAHCADGSGALTSERKQFVHRPLVINVMPVFAGQHSAVRPDQKVRW